MHHRVAARVLPILVVVVLSSCGAFASLPTGFVGLWSGRPNVTVVGPLEHSFNFSITVLPNSSGNAWLMEDTFTGFLLTSSTQHFWVLADESGHNSTLTYCGILRGFFDLASGKIQGNFTQSFRNETVLQWALVAEPFGLPSASWTLSLSDNGTVLTSEFFLPPPVRHFLSTFRRVEGTTNVESRGLPHERPPQDVYYQSHLHLLSDQTRALIAAVSREDLRLGYLPYWACQFSGDEDEQKGSQRESSSRCPYAAQWQLSKTNANPLRLSGDRNQPVFSAPEPNANAKAIESEQAYQYCYIINPFLGIRLHWTWNISTESIDVLFVGNTSLALSDEVGAGSMMTYLALGIFPNWPAMEGMDIVMGYADNVGMTGGCVRSLYAEKYVGRPVANEGQLLRNTAVSKTADGVTSVQFSRPWKTGHHNLNGTYKLLVMPSFSWAMGLVDNANCSDPTSFHSHKTHRGTFGIWWPNPIGVLPDSMKC